MNPVSENALTVLQSRYLLRDDKGVLTEQPEALFRRVADAIAQAEDKFGGDRKKTAKEFFELMSSLKFLPNSPTLMNAGTVRQQLSACFVLPVGDSLISIFDTLKHAALIHQSGGGTGFNFSKIRPKNDFLPDSGGTASGPVSFMELFDASTERIKQGGKRRGANMGILNCDHPDIEQFISVKKDTSALRNFNISVGVTDAFMHAIEKDLEWNLIHPGTKEVMKKVRAKELWNAIIDNAWTTGDPGMIFLDSIERTNPTPKQGRIESTNPCGEVPLLPYEACNLGSINVSLFVKENKIDYDELKKVIHLSVRFLDNVIEENNYILPQIEETVKHNRKIGLGIMGWAELLIKLGIPYASEKAIALGEELMNFINTQAKIASHELAEERGPFEGWAKSIFRNTATLRNATCTAIAPTGTIAVIANTSPSIEPLFALAFRRENVLGGKTLVDVNEVAKDLLRSKGVYSDSLEKTILEKGTVSKTDLPEEIRSLLLTSHEIAPQWHLRHQAAFQKFTGNAVSKTINLPNNATREDIASIYIEAWKLNLKGITVFRDGCKPQVMNTGASCEICVS
ncbi:MAG TPA: adenosylcobalamin-dependent ribonucleoside-diphosphate reductase [Bacteroidia bacterium]|jgi:ribonucleoside-diphosphate reductase alpha chain|nr:adenosylcobalamin-dependent ribonucleoside-diphosphate reductase [Bacteroidia bacterium]